jgi:FtsZ-binding cell division protein ZapB
MKWPTFAPQKKLYAFCYLLLVVVVVLAMDHIVLRRETARLKRAVAAANATSAARPDVSAGIERDLKNLELRVAGIDSDLRGLETKVRRTTDVETRVSSLEYAAGRLKERIDDLPGTSSTAMGNLEREVQSLKRETDQHAKHIRDIMGKVGMWLPADLLGR